MKKLFIPALLIAGALSSCSKDEVTSVSAASDAQTVNSVGLDISAAVTRALDANADAIRTSASATLFYYSDATISSSNPSGSIVFTYDAGDAVWSQNGTDIAWSSILGSTAEDSEDTTGTATFYSMHDGVTGSLALTTDSSAKTASTTAEYVVKDEIALQEDVLYYTGQITEIPSGGKITATFTHALSRIEMYSNQGDYKPYVDNVELCYVLGQGTGTISDDYSITWTSTAATATSSYTYFDYTTEATGFAMKDGELITEGTIVAGDITYESDETNSMIIIPQTLAAENFDGIFGVDNADYIAYANTGTYTTTTGDVTTIDYYDALYNAELTNPYYTTITSVLGTFPYVSSIYRMVDANGDDVVGYANAVNSLEYEKMVDNGITIYPVDSNSGVSLVGDDTPLYVYAAFGFSEAQTLLPTYDYDFMIGYGVTGGTLLVDYYYLSDGTMTNIPIESLTPGDQILASEDTLVGLMVKSTDWIDGGSINAD